MVLEFKSGDKFVGSSDFGNVYMREYIYKNPFSIEITYNQQPTHKEFLKGDKCELVFIEGTTINLVVNSVSHDNKKTKIVFIHKEFYRLLNNLCDTGEEVLGETLEHYVTRDGDAHANLREVLSKKGLVVISDRTELTKAHITDYQGRELKHFSPIISKVNINSMGETQKYSAYSRKDPYIETATGTTRSLNLFGTTKEEIEAMNKRIIPKVTILCSDLNLGINLMDKAFYAEIEYCVMGIQRNSRAGSNLAYFTLGLIEEDRR